MVITTKVGFRNGTGLIQAGLSRRHILWSIDQSLKRLDTDWVDLYIAHKEDPYTKLEVTLAALDEVVRSGKARYIGFSNWPAWKASERSEGSNVPERKRREWTRKSEERRFSKSFAGGKGEVPRPWSYKKPMGGRPSRTGR